ncbi:hypothetical protein V8C86DRAFT_2442034 [Haematococcus lacustris]
MSSTLVTCGSQQKDPQKEVPAGWWTNLKAASPTIVKKAKEFCTSGKLKVMRLHYARMHMVACLNGDVAARLLSELCKCVHGAHVNNINLENLRDRCLDLLDLVLDVLKMGAFMSTSKSSPELPKLPQAFTKIMNRFSAFLEEAKAYCETYATKGFFAEAGRLLLHRKHNQRFNELVAELSSLTSGYRELIRQPHLKALWSDYFMHEQAVRWGVWWIVFPSELALDDTLDKAAREKLMDLLKDKDSKDAFRRAVEVEETIFISIDELCLRFPDDSPLLPTVEALLCEGRGLVLRDKDQEKTAIDEAGQGQKLVLKDQTLKQVALDEAAHNQELLVDLLASPEAQAAFKRAVEVKDSIFLGIDELRRSFPADQPLLERVKTLLQPPPPLPSGQKPVRVTTEYWGREQQIQELGELLANSYGVLLLHGPPGIGKTCLAVDVGWHMWEKGCLPGGAVLVPLKGAASARKQQQRLSEALGVHHVNDALDRIRSAGRMLLILDAAEACLLGAEVGAFVALLNTVMACHPHLVVLVTSAVPWPTSLPRLGAYMERRVPPLHDMVITALVNARCGPGVLSAAQVQLVVAACRGSPLLARKCADACASGRATWMECVEYARQQRRRQDAEAAAEAMAAARPGTQPMWRSSAY